MSEAQELRARRRYRTLLREAEKLQQQGKTDEKLAYELQKLLLEYPNMKETLGSVERWINETINNSLNRDMNYQSPNEAPSLSSASWSSSVEGKCDSSCFIATPSISAAPITRPTEHSDDVGESASKDTFLPFSGGTALFLGAISIYSEAILPSSLSVHSYMMILLFSILAALFHRYAVDPYHSVGKAVSPIVLGCLVHIHNLFSLHMKQPGRISKAMLFIYLLLDLLPSMVFVFVVYKLTLLSTELLV